MSEEKKNEEIEEVSENKEEEVIRIPLKRHLWPEEVELKNAKESAKRWKKAAIIVSLICLVVGFSAGNIVTLPAFSKLRSLYQNAFGANENEKLETVQDIMENTWYFSKDIEDIDERLLDQAIEGMTTNEEDAHTEYMTAAETESFVQSINRNYVGIGTQFIMYNSYPMCTKVFNNSPAEAAGLQAGDIITAVDGVDIYGYSSDEVKEAIQGEEGTDVVITVSRGGESIDLTITRGQVSATTYAKMINDNTLYLQLYQFGESTAEDVQESLDELISDHTDVKMILDLRSNGGGYLNSVQALASLFLDAGDTVLIQEFTDGSQNVVTATSGKYEQVHDIVILVDDGTASAAEVMTLALKQNRDDVTVVGVTTYGKGTVQTTTYFSDGSALKYTTSRWLSPNEDWINGTGITPDEVVELPDALTTTFAAMEKEDVYQYDDVSDVVASVQLVLEYFGYDVDRKDGYFSLQTQALWEQFESDYGIEGDATITYDSYMQALSEVMYDWATTDTHDTQLQKAEELLNG